MTGEREEGVVEKSLTLLTEVLSYYHRVMNSVYICQTTVLCTCYEEKK